MAVLLGDGFSPCDASKFMTFGLFREDAAVPVQVRFTGRESLPCLAP